eukprot:TRINITY_DN23980_c0_g1_i1.p1 TRINITY_DN23980_c0_g1~~TRINITY_DN23980_c0_g1_i1.p1  ORF type:complete len:418 (+),score=98.86 TRINITY_DN23980_c0_g1_i1:40-1293(+)
MSLFDIAESSWWAKALYSLMRLDASYPNSTAVTEEEVVLLLFLGVAALCLFLWVPYKLARVTTSSGGIPMLKNLVPVVIVSYMCVWMKVQVDSRYGSYIARPKKITEVPEYKGAITPDVFKNTYKGLPVVARGVLNPQSLKRWEPAALAKAFKGSRAAMQLGNVEQGEAGYGDYELGEFFSKMDDPEWVKQISDKTGGGVPYLAEENNILRQGGSEYMDAVSDLFKQTLIAENDTSFHFTDVWIWAGPRGVKTGLHADWDPTNLLHQLHGEKTIWLLHPSESPKCYPSTKYDMGATIANVDPFDPDFEKYPKYKDAHIMRVDIRPGDVIQVPAGWMHYAACQTTSCVSLSGRSFSFPETVAMLPVLAGAVLHRFGLYGAGSSTSGYVAGDEETVSSDDIMARLSRLAWYRAGEEYDN